MIFDIKARKRQLIAENIDSSSLAKKGRINAKISVLVILITRIAFLVFDCIYLAVINADNNIWLQLLILPLIILLYMIYDGNKAMSYIIMISAAARMIYHFTTIIPALPTEGITFYTIIYLIVFEIQFALAVFLSASPKCDIYFTAMQKINIKIRSEMIGR